MKKITWGILLLLTAALIFLYAIDAPLGFIRENLSVRALLGCLLCVAILVNLITEKEWEALPLLGGALLLILEKPLAAWLGRPGEDLYSFWIVLLCATLACAGISCLTDPIKKHRRQHVRIGTSDRSSAGSREDDDNDDDRDDGDEDRTEYGEDARYIDCRRFTHYEYGVRMGSADIYFEHIEDYKSGAVLTLTCKLGNIVVHVPSGWRIQCEMSNSLGAITTPTHIPGDGPVLIIRGANKLGNVEILYD